MRRFNTEGPVIAGEHYHIPPLERVNLGRILELIGEKRYFVLHAPRQTGKTSALLALRDRLNRGSEGGFRCVYVNIEAAQAMRGNVLPAIRVIVGELASRASDLGDDFLTRTWPDVFSTYGEGTLAEALTRWCQADSKPLVLLIDEIDSLVGDTLISVLRQLRSRYDRRPKGFPQSVVLCGVRDVRDYRIRSGTGEVVTGGSAFNIRAESLLLGDFTQKQVRTLMAQHTKETGQRFAAEAAATVWHRTRGQPWLVNALCYEACFRNDANRDRSRTVTADDILDAQEALIVQRVTHLDQLADKLREDRVRRVVEPLLSGGDRHAFSEEDLGYVRDLGLIARDGLRIANPIYAEVVPRQLTYAAQAALTQQMAWYVDADGGLDLPKLLEAFQTFYREHSEHWLGRFDYAEAGPQLLLQAFLQRIVNGGGRIEREYGLGRGRTDLLIVWPRGDAPGDLDKFVVECKVLHKARSLAGTLAKGLEQTAGYMGRCGTPAGHLVLFDPDRDRPWDDKVFRREEAQDGKTITVWGM